MHLIISGVKLSSSLELKNIPSIIYSSHELAAKEFIAIISDVINIISWTLCNNNTSMFSKSWLFFPFFFFRALNWQDNLKNNSKGILIRSASRPKPIYTDESQLLTFQHPSNTWKPNRHKIFTYHWVLAWSQKCGVSKEDQTLQW